ncbi:MAG: DUF1295 domain-containing protein [Chitinophagales bacterium]|nr:DUF1295 domain-containing protein [Chitinophagales bacterium]
MFQKAFLIVISCYHIIVIAWMVLAVITFLILLKITAPFGRHTAESWKPMINNKVAWFIMEFTVLAVLWFFLFPRITSLSIPVLIMVGLFTIHYLNRSLIFPLRIRTRKKKMPLVIMLSAVFFNLMNGYLLGFYFVFYASYDLSWLYDIRFISGILLFISGMIINWRADNILIHLRKGNETGYKIPYGGLFKYVSCPNLLGEIIEWSGFALLCWNLPALAFLVWTCANLIPRAIAHHQWYKEKFTEYPVERKALIPFLL